MTDTQIVNGDFCRIHCKVYGLIFLRKSNPHLPDFNYATFKQQIVNMMTLFGSSTSCVLSILLLSLASNVGGQDRPTASIGQRDLVTTWGEKVRIEETVSNFETPYRLISKPVTLKGSTVIRFSSSAFENILALKPVTDSDKKTIENLAIPTPSALLTLYVNAYIKANIQGCNKEQLKETMLSQILLSNLNGNMDAPNVLERVRQLSKVYNEYFKDRSKCHLTDGAWLFSAAADPNVLVGKGNYVGFFPMAILNANARVNCSPPMFPVGTRAYVDFQCAQKKENDFSQPITATDILFPISGFAFFLEKNGGTKEEIAILFQKLIEAGIYFPGLPFKYLVRSKLAPEKVELNIDGTDLGILSWDDLNPMLKDLVRIDSCRQLLTENGIQTYCLKEVKAGKEKAGNKN